MSRPPFRVAWTGDFRQPDGTPHFADVGTSVFAGHPHFRAKWRRCAAQAHPVRNERAV